MGRQAENLAEQRRSAISFMAQNAKAKDSLPRGFLQVQGAAAQTAGGAVCLSASQRENDAPRPPLAGADYARRAANIAARQFRSISKT